MPILCPGLTLGPLVPLFSYGLKPRSSFDQQGCWEAAQTHTLCCNLVTMLPAGKIAAPWGLAATFQSIKHGVSPPECHSSGKSKENPGAKHKTND